MLAVAVCFLTLAVAFDLRTDHIPNALNLTGLAIGLVAAFVRGGPTGLVHDVGAVAAMFAAAYVLFVIHAMRGGDGKLLIAIAAMFGLAGGFTILLYALILAALIGLPKLLQNLILQKGKKTRIHCSLPIACGTALYFMINGGMK